MICLKGRQPQLARLLGCVQCEHEMSNHDATRRPRCRFGMMRWNGNGTGSDGGELLRSPLLLPARRWFLSPFSARFRSRTRKAPPCLTTLPHVHDPTRSGPPPSHQLSLLCASARSVAAAAAPLPDILRYAEYEILVRVSIVSGSDPFPFERSKCSKTIWVRLHFHNCEHLAVSDSIFEGEVGYALSIRHSAQTNRLTLTQMDGRERGRGRS